LIYNPLAGSVKDPHILPAILHPFQNMDWEMQVHTISVFADIGRLAAAARQAGQDAVIVVGGDGSLNAAVNALANSNVALGVIPAGTGNVWARQIGLPVPSIFHPNALVEAARMMAGGHTFTIDLGIASGRYFLLWAGAGLDAHVVAAIEPKPVFVRRFGPIGYGLFVIWSALRYHGLPMSVEIDGKTFEGRYVLAIASNARLYARMRLAPQACLDDGMLDVFLFSGRGVVDLLFHAIYLLTGKVSHDPRTIIVPGRKIHLRSAQVCPIHIDAEPFTHAPVDIEVVPGALRVILPTTMPASLVKISTQVN
jgi:YegS/Rv2252/BmrU family lipid kinase